jgi:hypothetical protein
MTKLFSLRKLFLNSFPGHKGRPGQVGGSQPAGGSGGVKHDPPRASRRRKQEVRDSLKDAMSFEKGFPNKLGNLANPKTVAELKTGLKSLKGPGDLRGQAKEILTGSGWNYITRDEISGADVYGKGPFITEIYFGRGKTQVQFRKKGKSYQSL